MMMKFIMFKYRWMIHATQPVAETPALTGTAVFPKICLFVLCSVIICFCFVLLMSTDIRLYCAHSTTKSTVLIGVFSWKNGKWLFQSDDEYSNRPKIILEGVGFFRRPKVVTRTTLFAFEKKCRKIVDLGRIKITWGYIPNFRRKCADKVF